MINYFVNFLLFILPCSRFFSFKRFLLKIIGAKIGNNVRVMNIKVQGVDLEIGDNTFIGNDTFITGGKSKVIIGENCDISSRVSFVTGTHEIGTKYRAAGNGYSKDIKIGNGVWIGYGAIILPGVTVGDGVIIAAGSIVTSNLPSGVLAAGCPAKIKKQLFRVC
jgi:maltose O-acetyltransferase